MSARSPLEVDAGPDYGYDYGYWDRGYRFTGGPARGPARVHALLAHLITVARAGSARTTAFAAGVTRYGVGFESWEHAMHILSTRTYDEAGTAVGPYYIGAVCRKVTVHGAC